MLDELLPAVRETIAALNTTDKDAGIIRLAEHYAEAIDAAQPEKPHAWALRYLGPLLHDALVSLGATPAARTRTQGGVAADGGSKLAVLRAAHFSASLRED